MSHKLVFKKGRDESFRLSYSLVGLIVIPQYIIVPILHCERVYQRVGEEMHSMKMVG